jgi:hypothetical protein
MASYDLNAVISAEQFFGQNPWVANPTGHGPLGSFSLNPQYFATLSTAQKVAAMVGGTVVSVDVFAQTPGNPFAQDQPTLFVQLATGEMINPGLVAGFFTHGYTLGLVVQQLKGEVALVRQETSGVAADPSAVVITLPSTPDAPAETAPAIGDFCSPIPLGATDGRSFNMYTANSTEALKFNGATRVNPANGKTYRGTVTQNAFLGSVTGRWDLIQ